MKIEIEKYNDLYFLYGYNKEDKVVISDFSTNLWRLLTDPELIDVIVEEFEEQNKCGQ